MKGEALDSKHWRTGCGSSYGSDARRRYDLKNGVNGFLTVYMFK